MHGLSKAAITAPMSPDVARTFASSTFCPAGASGPRRIRVTASRTRIWGRGGALEILGLEVAELNLQFIFCRHHGAAARPG